MADLKVVSEFTPAGDQPQAIKSLSDGINKWHSCPGSYNSGH